MSGTVKLYDELCLCTVKIGNILSENLLTRKADGIDTQKIIPKVLFFFGHILSQHFCGCDNVFIMFSLHYNPSVTAKPCHLPLHKGGFLIALQCFNAVK